MVPPAPTAAPLGTTHGRTEQRRRPRRPRPARRVAALRGSSKYSCSGHPRAANENRTCGRRGRETGQAGRKLLALHSAPSGLEAALRRPRREARDLGWVFPAVPRRSVCALWCCGGRCLGFAGPGKIFPPRATEAPYAFPTYNTVPLNLR